MHESAKGFKDGSEKSSKIPLC